MPLRLVETRWRRGIQPIVRPLAHLTRSFSPAGTPWFARTDDDRAFTYLEVHLLLQASLLDDGLREAYPTGIADTDETGFHPVTPVTTLYSRPGRPRNSPSNTEFTCDGGRALARPRQVQWLLSGTPMESIT